jgi:preprotein translocase subunit SecG
VSILTAILNVLLVICSLFLICLILIQRGKGGGLAGAFGGVGGSSAFGTKAGDVFTRITIIVAGIWIVLNMLLVVLSNRGPTTAGQKYFSGSGTQQAPSSPGGAAGAPAGDAKGAPGKGAGEAPAEGKSPAAPSEGDASLPAALPSSSEAPAGDTAKPKAP